MYLILLLIIYMYLDATRYYLTKDGVDDVIIEKIMNTYSDNRPWYLLQLLSKEIHSNKFNDAVIENHFQLSLRELDCVIGGCERILKTPIPTSYTRHTSRFLSMWTFSVPFILWESCGIYTIPASLFISYSLFCIEDIGVTIEQPCESFSP